MLSKRVLSVLLILVMFLGAASAGLVGYAENAKDEYVISLLVESSPLKRSDETTQGKYIKDRFGIVFEYIVYTGDMREKQNLMLSAGDYGEIQAMQREDIVKSYIEAGALLDIDSYLKKMPMFQERYKEQIPYWRIPGEGKLYKWENWIPQEIPNDYASQIYDIMIRSDALEAQGWPLPVSADGWVEFLQKAVDSGLTDINGDPCIGLVVPFAEGWGLAGVSGILYEKSDRHVAVGNEGFLYNIKDHVFEDYFKSPYVKESLKFFNNLYQRGLLDEECFTTVQDQVREKIAKAAPIAIWYTSWLVNNRNIEALGYPQYQYMKMPIQSNLSVSNGEKYAVRVETTRPFSSWGVTKNCKDPERLFAFIEWACTDEGRNIIANGVEGVHWEVVDGVRQFTELGRECLIDEEVRNKELCAFPCMPAFSTLAPDGKPYVLSNDLEFREKSLLTDREKEVLAAYGWKTSIDWWLENGFSASTGLAGALNTDPTTELGKTHQKMVELRLRYSARLIMAKNDAEFESIYEEAMIEYEKLNPQTVIEYLNERLRNDVVKLEEYSK